MAKKKNVYGIALPTLTRGKVLRLFFFVLATALGFVLNRYVPAVRSFGWGYTFGLVGMAILTG